MTEMSAAEAAIVARFDAAEPAPESWGGGLREALWEAVATVRDASPRRSDDADTYDVVDAVLALPEVADLRAKAAAADRVRELAEKVLRAAAQEQRNEANNVPWDDEGTHADGHRCAADFLDRRADLLAADDRTDRGRC